MYHRAKFFHREIKIVKLNKYARQCGICSHSPASFTIETKRHKEKTLKSIGELIIFWQGQRKERGEGMS